MNVNKVQCIKCKTELNWWSYKNDQSGVIGVGACLRCRDKETAENNVTISMPSLLKMLDDNEVLR